MGPIRYSLCNKAVIGIAMWITGLCAIPPLIAPTGISLQKPGVVLRRDFNVPVDKAYAMNLHFVSASTDPQRSDQLIGDGRSNKYCDGSTPYDSIPLHARQGLGLPVPLKVVVRKQPEGTLVMERTFQALCKTFYSAEEKGRRVGWIKLGEGTYQIEVFNQLAQPAFKDLNAKISLGILEPK